jgi:hypothetical protein
MGSLFSVAAISMWTSVANEGSHNCDPCKINFHEYPQISPDLRAFQPKNRRNPLPRNAIRPRAFPQSAKPLYRVEKPFFASLSMRAERQPLQHPCPSVRSAVKPRRSPGAPGSSWFNRGWESKSKMHSSAHLRPKLASSSKTALPARIFGRIFHPPARIFSWCRASSFHPTQNPTPQRHQLFQAVAFLLSSQDFSLCVFYASVSLWFRSVWLRSAVPSQSPTLRSRCQIGRTARPRPEITPSIPRISALPDWYAICS